MIDRERENDRERERDRERDREREDRERERERERIERDREREREREREILHGESIELFLVPDSNKGHGMCYPVCGMVHIKEPLLLIRKSNTCGGSRLHISLSEWSFYHMSDAI